ncbi:MAG: PAC2 family protein [Nitrososphaerales archaeon]
MTSIIYTELPTLSSPYLIVGLAGWTDAGLVASHSTRYLIRALKMTKFASIDPDEYYTFNIERPTTAINLGVIEDLKFATNELYYLIGKESGINIDLILLTGVEPHLRWAKYVREIVDISSKLGVKFCYALGGLLDRVPHTRPPLISAVVNDPSLAPLLTSKNLKMIDYEGPASLYTYLLTELRKKGILGASLWGHVPQYIAHTDANTSLHLLRRLSDLLNTKFNLTELENEAKRLKETLDKEVAQDSALTSLVRSLELEYDMRSGPSYIT